MRFGGKNQRVSSDDVQKLDDGGGASAASRGDIEKQPQDVKKRNSDSSTDGEDFENKSHNSEADALYSECDS